MAETEGGTLADTSPSLAEFVGGMFGDIPAAEPEQDAGSPPSAALDATADRPEGDAASAPTGDPPVAADPNAAPDTSTTETPDADPLEGSKPFDYAVDGQSKTFDGITVLRDGAGIIEPDAMQRLQQVISRHDHLAEQGRKDYERYSALERATTWQTRDAQGNPKTITGPEAVWESRAMLARAAASLKTINDVFSDPQKFASLVAANENGEIVINPMALEALRDRTENAALKAVEQARTNFGQITQPPPPPETPITDVAGPTIESFVTQFQIQGLTPEDKTFLAGQLPRYITGTGQQRAVDPSFIEVMKDRAALRASQTKTVDVAAKAALANAPKLAAAAIGKKPAVQPPKIVNAPAPEPSRADDFDALWDRNAKAAAGAMRAKQLGG